MVKGFPSVTVLPPSIGYMLAAIGQNEFHTSIAKISRELGVSTLSLNKFLTNLISNEDKRIKIGEKEVVFPHNLLVKSETLSKPCTFKSSFRSTKLFYIRPKAPINLNLMVTTKCYTNCCYCYAKRKFDYELTTDEILSLIDNCKEIGIVNLNLTGGDIFSRKDWKKIVAVVKKYGYNPFMSTKTPICEDDVAFLKSLGVSELQFSLDSVSPAILKILIEVNEGYFSQVVKMFEVCEKYGIKIAVRTVLCKQNADVSYIKKLYEFINKYNIIKDWVLTPAFFSEYRKYYEQYEASNVQLTETGKYIKSLKSSFPIYLSQISSCGYSLKNCSTVEEYVSTNQRCFANSYSMSILASGECTICEMLYDNKNFSLGNIRKQRLLDIWNGSKALKLYSPKQSEMSDRSPCHNCTVFDKCKSSIAKRVCYVDIAKVNKDNAFSMPDPRCPMAENVNVIL